MEDQPQVPPGGVNKGGAKARPQTRSQAASFVSPPGSKTPPSMPAKKTIVYSDNLGSNPRAQEGSEAVDHGALAKALKNFEGTGHRREHTPGTSPCRKRQRVYGDR